jgi:hypothetical protein
VVELPHSAVCGCGVLLPHSADLPQSAALLLPEAMKALFPQTLDADHGPVWPHSEIGLITAVASPVVVLYVAIGDIAVPDGTDPSKPNKTLVGLLTQQGDAGARSSVMPPRVSFGLGFIGALWRSWNLSSSAPREKGQVLPARKGRTE